MRDRVLTDVLLDELSGQVFDAREVRRDDCIPVIAAAALAP